LLAAGRDITFPTGHPSAVSAAGRYIEKFIDQSRQIFSHPWAALGYLNPPAWGLLRGVSIRLRHRGAWGRRRTLKSVLHRQAVSV